MTSGCGRWITVPKNRQQHPDNRLKSHATHRRVPSIRGSGLVLYQNKIKVYQVTSRSLKAISPSQFAGHMAQVSCKKMKYRSHCYVLFCDYMIQRSVNQLFFFCSTACSFAISYSFVPITWTVTKVNYLYHTTVCPTRYRPRNFFNNFTTNEDICNEISSGFTSLCKKCDGIITCAGSGHYLRPDRIEPGAPYFGKSLPVRPLSLPEFLQWC